MIVALMMWISEWLVSSLLDKVLSENVRKILGKNAFQTLTQKALQQVLKKEDNLIIWNEIMSMTDLKIKDPTEFDFAQICSHLSSENQELCQSFFQDLREEYLNQVYLLGSKDPALKFLLEKKKQSSDFEKRLEMVKEGIKRKRVDISDFVGRKDIIENFPPGDVFICGKAAFGKTYLMLKLCSLFNGYYIPLDVVKENLILAFAGSDTHEGIMDRPMEGPLP